MVDTVARFRYLPYMQTGTEGKRTMARTAINIEAVTFTAECPCGGEVMMAGTGSLLLTPGDAMVCSECDSEITFGSRKTARI